ncbi:CUE domain-containing protein 1b [Polypterus senegalus]|uniref:CUE domain-containing protein 1b n=1 Tax=Polypterus senegalus TaxID=55291 RepID=UPI0019658564|nr:CUE domain-containing protein 1b [Polypterus senegalus]XP_039612618.1 CUE domain-containing protein 1b [Polypterus senegalus]XP_039612619.1 CUE domain-containing protein 1b [Polypterus senegalus]
MTSLFRRSSNGSSRNGSATNNGTASGAGTTQELNNSRPARQVRRLEFNQAMEDFKTMFPNMDYDVIECVLRANNGAVDATIDQLLQMNIEGHSLDDSSDSDDSIPPEILERTLEPDSSDEEPPPVYSPPTYDMHIYDRKYPEAPPTPPPRFDAQPTLVPQQPRHYRNWNPPLLGNLPDDFLRILPQQMESMQNSTSSMLQGRTLVPAQGGAGGALQVCQGAATEQEHKLKQYLEDERIALFLQNEEFMKELQRNREFLIALERDRLKYESKKSKSNLAGMGMENPPGDHSAPCLGEACHGVSDDALFRDKLKHMGKSTRKKLFEIARTFSEKTKMRKPKRKTLLKHQSLGSAASTANLLDDVEGNSCDEDTLTRRQLAVQEEGSLHKEGLS